MIHSMARAVSWVAALAMLALHGAPVRAQQADLVLEQTVAPRIPVFVAPGGEAIKTIVIVNQGDAVSGPIRLHAYSWLIRPALPDSPFTSLGGDGCPEIVVEPDNVLISLWRFRLDLPALAPGERHTCSYRYARSPDNLDDRQIFWSIVEPTDDPGPVGNTVAYVLGTLTHMHLTTAPHCSNELDKDQVEATITLANHGPGDVAAQQFGACLNNYVPAFSIDGNFEGGCGPQAGVPGFCFGFSIGWMMPALRAGESHSCRLRLQWREGQPGSPAISVRAIEPYSGIEPGVRLRDINPQMTWAVLNFGQIAAECQEQEIEPMPAPVPAQSRWSWWFLLAGILVLAMRQGSWKPSRRRP